MRMVGTSDLPVLFFLASMDFHTQAKRMPPEDRREAAVLVFDAFLKKPKVARQLSLSSYKLIDDIAAQLNDPPPWIFDAAASDAFGQMDRQFFNAFKRSSMYQLAVDKAGCATPPSPPPPRP
jgi:hypothetical protein